MSCVEVGGEFWQSVPADGGFFTAALLLLLLLLWAAVLFWRQGAVVTVVEAEQLLDAESALRHVVLFGGFAC